MTVPFGPDLRRGLPARPIRTIRTASGTRTRRRWST